MKRLLLVLLLASCGGDEANSPELLAAEPTYERDIRPLYERYCVECHSREGAKAGGVELDRYESAFGTRVKAACTAVRPALVERYEALLQPTPRSGGDDRGTCAEWEIFSMPTAVKDKLTPHEQVLLLRWIETGAPR